MLVKVLQLKKHLLESPIAAFNGQNSAATKKKKRSQDF